MKRPRRYAASMAATFAAASMAICATPLAAQEAFAGIYAHEPALFSTQVDWPQAGAAGRPDQQPGSARKKSNTGEDGTNLAGGYRFAEIEPVLHTRPYIFASLNLDGGTNLVGGGLSWRIGSHIYLRPAIGIAVHDGPDMRRDDAGARTDMGGRVLFVPELAIGAQLNDSLSAEISWIHASHKSLWSQQNPGLDMIGLRLNWRM